MAQRMVDGEEYTSVLIKGGEDGSAIETITNGGSAVVSFLRPGDATAYTAGDIVAPSGAGYVSFSGLTANNGDIYITNAKLAFQANAVPAGMGAFRLHLFSSPPSGLSDNAAFSVTTSSILSYQGFVEILSPIAFGDHIYRQNETANLQVSLASGSSTIYGVLQTVNGWTPASGTPVRAEIDYLPL